MKNLRWIIFLFCIVLQFFFWLAPDTDFVNGIFYVNDVGGDDYKVILLGSTSIFIFIMVQLIVYIVAKKMYFFNFIIFYWNRFYGKSIYV